MDASMDFETTVRWLTFIPIIACSVFGLGLTLAKWRQFRRQLLPDDAVLGQMRRLIDVGDL